jgi:nucleotide-binding universal stress UspA family protein
MEAGVHHIEPAKTDRGGPPLRVLIALHGAEAPGWDAAVGRLVARWGEPIVRVLGILEVPRPALTSFTPWAREAWNGARSEWRRQEEARIGQRLAALRQWLPSGAEILLVAPERADPLQPIVKEVGRWLADLVVVGAPAGRRGWLWPGPLHRRAIRRLGCPVLVATSAGAAPTWVSVAGSAPLAAGARGRG